MSFLFKSKQKGAQSSPSPSPLPPATRDIRSSDGPSSQIPTLNGAALGQAKPSSPTPSGSVNNSINSLASHEQAVRVGQRPPDGRNSPFSSADGARASIPSSPEQKTLQREKNDQVVRQSRMPVPGLARPPQSQDPSPYPWSSRPLDFPPPHGNPFPRYGAAVNATASKDGSVYLMGGLINGSTVKGDLWTVEPNQGTLVCYPVATTSEGPGPRVGHASLLVGNAFIVFGGDTKMDDGDMLDDTLYLLNTSSKQWSRALPAGPRPPGRYGHTLNILGSKIYIFGGQVEGYFFNDLYAFDLNALQQSQNTWELLVQNTIDGGPPHGQIPPARTNHTMIAWADKLYLFGGTDGVHWFNDVWSYSPQTAAWTCLECIGYIPAPREGHAAALVGDVMYIFGGRTEDGNDLGDLAAFRLTSRRWYTFQNMGPSPSPRSGHSMTTVGRQIVVLAGEPSSAPRDPVELSFAYFLDTTKIRYPPDAASQGPPGQRRPSNDRIGLTLGSPGQGQGAIMARDAMAISRDSRLPQARGLARDLPAPSAPPPPAPLQQTRVKSNSVTSRQPTRGMSPSSETERMQSFDRTGMSPPPHHTLPTVPETVAPTSATGFVGSAPYYETEENETQRQVETYQPSQESEILNRSSSRGHRQQPPVQPDETERTTSPAVEQLPKVRSLQQEEEQQRPQDSGIGSSPALVQQHDEIIREMEQVKQRNAWLVSELALARKSGYAPRGATDSPVLDQQAPAALNEDDKPLVEALLKMRAELTRVQQTIDEQSRSAAERIAEMEKQRDTAIAEAVYAKTRLAGHATPEPDSERMRSPDQERNSDMARRLASSLSAQAELSRRIDGLIHEVEAEKNARQLAEETSEAAQRRVSELDGHRQQNSSDLESVRAELHDTQIRARDLAANHAEIQSRHDMLVIDKDEMKNRLDGARADTQDHTAVLSALRDAVTASTDKATLLEQRLESERQARDELEIRLRQLRSEHEERTLALESTTERLRESEEMAGKHADEARAHRQAVMAGLDKVTQHDVAASQNVDQRVATLQRQVEAANSLVRENQSSADTASEKLRRAEERIAGLEAFQEQASREGLSVRKQLQATIKDHQSLVAQKVDLESRLQSQMLETNALAVQHASLKDVLGERGINPSEVRRSRALDSPVSNLSRFSTPDLLRMRELEQQLEASLKSHDDIRSQFEEVSERDEKMKREYEDKLTALDNDHQAAVKYLRGTERMLSKMKQELQRVKNENSDLRTKVETAQEEATTERSSTDGTNNSSAWAAEREKMQIDFANVQATLHASVADLETRIDNLTHQLSHVTTDLERTRSAHATSQADLVELQAAYTQSRAHLERLRRDNSLLDERARDAEGKVNLLLGQVESSVDNYRRQSRLHEGTGTATLNGVYPHSRNLSNISALSASGTANGHVRHGSDASMVSPLVSPSSPAADDETRNSLALDSLASELETLRSHWETTNKNYRLSDRFDFESAGPVSTGNGNGTGDLHVDGASESVDLQQQQQQQHQQEQQALPPTVGAADPLSPVKEIVDETDLATPTVERPLGLVE